ncbi:hypothetical protein FHG87_011952 [Trinorchestia longiramus]|nr:hypothetical protein FHG87_011952 [Trinorchestia longiramus]
MESNQNSEKALKATYSLQLFNIRGCNMEECGCCYSNHESVTNIENQSRKIQKLSRQLELNHQLEFNHQIEMLAGRVVTIEIKQKQNYEHELRLQSSETHLDQHIWTTNQPPHIEIIVKRSNFHPNPRNRFNALKDEMENNALKDEIEININSAEKQAIQNQTNIIHTKLNLIPNLRESSNLFAN